MCMSMYNVNVYINVCLLQTYDGPGVWFICLLKQQYLIPTIDQDSHRFILLLYTLPM